MLDEENMDAVGWVEHDYVDGLRAIVHLIAGSWIRPSVSSSAVSACTTAMHSPRSVSAVAADTKNSNG